MRSFSKSFRSNAPRLGAAGLACALFGLLAACSSPPAQGISNASSNLAQRLNLNSTSSSDPIPKRAELEDARGCPRAVIRDGTQTLRVYERGADGDPEFIRYQGSIMKIARECTWSGDEIVSIKFGVSGRVVIGPRGGEGTYSLPLRVAFVARGEAPMWGDLFTQSVTIGPGQTSADYVMVQQTPGLTIPAGADVTRYLLYVGFDGQGG
ncbi:hypothetical protein ACKTEK_02000 [Tepidamorphus sp. 3E244]|uniref:hypothetical protein n=1 Tax=Tepidamorphus sp. 3E244 TaxID=3385498 RepID=UPI0038FC2DA7